MAVSLGPWIEPTVVLLATALLSFVVRSAAKRTTALTLVTAGASIGGILAIGCGFAFPTLYFLDPQLFTSWLSCPFYFIALLATVAFVSGAFGLLIANYYEHQLLDVDQLAFPIGQMAYKMIAVQDQLHKATQLCVSFIGTLVYSILLTILKLPNSVILFTRTVFSWCTIPPIRLVLLELPMLWSIGFVTGHVIAVPMLVGILTKTFICMPAYTQFFGHLQQDAFFLAFCSGLILYGCVLGFLGLRKNLWGWVKGIFKNGSHPFDYGCWPSLRAIGLKPFVVSESREPEGPRGSSRIHTNGMMTLLILIALIAVLTNFNFSIPAQLYLLILTVVCTYQLLLIGGKVGIAPMPRFATFVMVPGILIFGFNGTQATIVSTLIEVCGGVAVDILFGRKMAQLAAVDRKKVIQYQWLGLVVSSIAVGIVFWLLINHFGLGSDQLFAQRAQTRALLIGISSFDFFALILGALYAAFLKELNINATLVLGGILMPLDYALLLTLGGLSSYMVHNKEAQYPFWSGMFAASSIWMILRALL